MEICGKSLRRGMASTPLSCGVGNICGGTNDDSNFHLAWAAVGLSKE